MISISRAERRKLTMTTAEQPAWQIPYAAGPARDGRMGVASVARVRVVKRMVVVVVLRVCKSRGNYVSEGRTLNVMLSGDCCSGIAVSLLKYCCFSVLTR